MERLWSGWRAAYISGIVPEPALGADGCLFCGLLRLDDAEALVLERTPRTFTVMNAYPYTTGHVMVAPVRHEGTVENLDGAEGAALFAGVQRAVRAIKVAFSPQGLNVGVNLGQVAGAGVPGHFHMHVLPRWSGDTNFMTSIAETRVLPEDLRTSWQRLVDVWPAADEQG